MVPVTYGSRLVGSVAMLEGGGGFPPEASEFLHLAATASATALALEQARERETAAPLGGLVEAVLQGRISGREAAARSNGELAGGLVVCAAAVHSSLAWEALALVGEAAVPVELVRDHLYALVPAQRDVEARGGPNGRRPDCGLTVRRWCPRSTRTPPTCRGPCAKRT